MGSHQVCSGRVQLTIAASGHLDMVFDCSIAVVRGANGQGLAPESPAGTTVVHKYHRGRKAQIHGVCWLEQ